MKFLQYKQRFTNLPCHDSFCSWHAIVLNDLFDVGKLLSDFPNLVQLHLVLHHQDAAVALLQDVLACLCPIGWVHPCSQPPSKYGPHIGNDPLRRVHTKKANSFKLFQSKLYKGLGYSPHILIVRRPCPHSLKFKYKGCPTDIRSLTSTPVSTSLTLSAGR